MKRLLVAVLLAGCAREPQAPTVLAEPMPVECPEPRARTPDPGLTAPLNLEPPAVLPKGEGDYGITRDGVEKMVNTYRAAKARLAEWKAWAQ